MSRMTADQIKGLDPDTAAAIVEELDVRREQAEERAASARDHARSSIVRVIGRVMVDIDKLERLNAGERAAVRKAMGMLIQRIDDDGAAT